MNERRMYRQGDVLIMEDVIPEGVKAVEGESGRLILARGEVTGHHHSVAAEDAELLTAGTADQIDMFLRVRSVSFLEHQEHATIELPRGTYRILRQVEYQPKALPRRVTD